jgi:Calcineurin-like phosphoesterase.
MRVLRYVSDLHLEFQPSILHPKIQSLWDSKPPGSYYLALLGDICNPFHVNFDAFLERVSPCYDAVFYIPGNHEYYNIDTWFPYNEFKRKMRESCLKYNIKLLDNESVNVEEFKVIGSTLWSYVPDIHKEEVGMKLNDYRLITTFSGEPITVKKTNKWNEKAVKFIEKELKDSSEKVCLERKCIVLTHHAPLFSDPEKGFYTANKKFLWSSTNCAFHNDLSRLMKSPIVAWLYGHTHYASKFEYNGVTIATNQLGYNYEVETGFNPYAYLDLDVLVRKGIS